MKSTKLGTRALAALIAVLAAGLTVAGIDGLARYCDAGAAGIRTAIVRSAPVMQPGKKT